MRQHRLNLLHLRSMKKNSNEIQLRKNHKKTEKAIQRNEKNHDKNKILSLSESDRKK